MPKSRKRGGEKAHRKRIQRRNQKLGIQQKQMQKMFDNLRNFNPSDLEESLKKISAMTENESSEITSEVETKVQNEEQISSETETQDASTEVENK